MFLLTQHLRTMAKLKHFSLQDIHDTLQHPQYINTVRRYPGQRRYMKNHICVVVDETTKTAITVYENWTMTPLRNDQKDDTLAIRYEQRRLQGLQRNGNRSLI